MQANAVNPVMGILIFMLGGLAGAVFYLPFKKVKNWAWESYWLVYAVFGLLLVPWILALATSPNVVPVLRAAPGDEMIYCLVCGAIWGFGGLVLLGGFIVNAGWCIVLNIRNKTAGDYVAKGVPVVPSLVFAGAAGRVERHQ